MLEAKRAIFEDEIFPASVIERLYGNNDAIREPVGQFVHVA